MFNTDAKRWDMLINPYFFCKKLDLLQQKAILLHELSHITHKHPLRVPFMKLAARKRQLMNIAMDMAINQFIKNLPAGCPECPPPDSGKRCENDLCPGRAIFVEDFQDTDEKTGKKIDWPKNATAEAYYEKLLRRFQDPDQDDKKNKGEPGDGQGQGEADGNAGGGADTGDLPTTIDEHMWDGAAEEKDMLDATEELVKRAMVKARLDYSSLPDSVRELLEEIKMRRAELNYKALLLLAMKRHAAGHDRKSTWTRKSKRFGNKAPGTKVGDLPRLELHLDTSGSISIEELNEFLTIVDEFLRVGARKCNLSFFHTSLYGRQQYKMNNKIDKSMIQSGGTDLAQTLQDVFKRRGNLSIIITDGCYGEVDWKSWLKPGEKEPTVLWIISKGGNEKHPMANLGTTIKVPDSATMGKK
jgi:predicted metal-dependent peptidase